jgi:hypothetical protein
VGSRGPFSSPPRHQQDHGQWWRASGRVSWVPMLIGPRGGSSAGDGPQRGSDPLELPSRELPQLREEAVRRWRGGAAVELPPRELLPPCRHAASRSSYRRASSPKYEEATSR